MKRTTTTVRRYMLAGFLSISLVPSMFGQTHKAPPTDWQIESQIQQTLKDDHAFAGSSIISSVSKGVVKLTGNVRSEAEKELVSSELGNITGVKSVLNNLNIVDDSFHAPPPRVPVAQGPTGPKVITLAAGTVLPIRLMDEIDTKTAKAGDIFHGTTASNVTLAAFTAIPTGTPVIGRIVEAKAAGHFTGSAELAVELVSVRLPGTTGSQDVSFVTQQLSNKAAGRGTNTAEKAGGGAAFGAVVGALAGGGAGAGIGAASGGALGLGANAFTRGKEIDLKPEQLLQFRTASPLDVTIMLQNGQQAPAITATATALQGRTDSASHP